MTAVAEHPPAKEVDADPVLKVDGLTVDIRTITGTVRAVNDVSFDACRGETLAMLGESAPLPVTASYGPGTCAQLLPSAANRATQTALNPGDA